MPQVEDDP